VILRGGDRRRQACEPKLLEPGQEALLLLAAEYTEDELRRVSRAASRHHAEDQAGEAGMVEIGDAAPFRPQRFLRGVRHASLLEPRRPSR